MVKITEQTIHPRNASPTVYALSPVDVSVNKARGIAKKRIAVISPKKLVRSLIVDNYPL
jgi:hypothetical protein